MRACRRREGGRWGSSGWIDVDGAAPRLHSIGMARREKRLENMRNNPRDWRISDVEALCKSFGILCEPPSGGGAHYGVAHPSQEEILTIPAHRPIKPVYIRLLVSFVDRVLAAPDEVEEP